jgi:tetratricopeptide (TPR) repeat protein
MFNQKKIKIIIFMFLAFILTACSPKEYSFEIDAPPKYSSEHVFKSMSVKKFTTNKSQYEQNIITMLKGGIAKEGYIKIVQNGGDSTLSGILHIGEISKNMDKSSYECKKKVDGKKVKTTCYSYTYTKKHLLKVDYSLRSNRDNSTVFGDTISEEFSDSWYSSSSASGAKSSATSDDKIINDSLKKIADKITKAVTPHKETISRELEEGKSDSVKLGITYIENGRVEQALAIWDQCIAKAESKEDVASSYYNIGVIKESKGEYRDAFAIYSKANMLLPQKELYIKAMTRVEKLKKRATKVRQWKSQ